MRQKRDQFVNMVESRGQKFWCGHLHKSQALALHCRNAYSELAKEAGELIGLSTIGTAPEFAPKALAPVFTPVAPPLVVAPKWDPRPVQNWAPTAPSAIAPVTPIKVGTVRIDPHPTCRFGQYTGELLERIPRHWLKDHLRYVERSITNPNKVEWLELNTEYRDEIARELEKRYAQTDGTGS